MSGETGTFKMYVSTSTGGGVGHGASIGLSVFQDVPTGGPDDVAFDTTYFDTDSYVSGSTLVIPSGLAGLYAVMSQIDMSTGSTDAFDVNWVIRVYQNATLAAYNQVHADANTPLNQQPAISRIMRLAEGDVLKTTAAGPGAGGFIILAEQFTTYLEIAWLGSA